MSIIPVRRKLERESLVESSMKPITTLDLLGVLVTARDLGFYLLSLPPGELSFKGADVHFAEEDVHQVIVVYINKVISCL